jgi:GAF domain-containing protein
MEWLRSIKVQRTIFGVFFGLLFPIVGTFIQLLTSGAPINGSSFLQAQSSNILLLVIDTAPIVLGFLFYMIGQREENSHEANRRMQEALQSSKDMQETLEQRVSARTQELEQQTLRVRSAAEIARDISSASTLNELLVRSSQLIIERFKFYHVGIFLLDDKKEYAVLRASPTEAGKQLIANSHRLRVGEQGIVGKVAASGEARIALDTGADAVYFNNPFLPTTRSEMALPLKTGDEVIGILDIQSAQPQAFTEQDIEIMQVLADQLTTAIERIRLLQQVESQLHEIEKASQEFTRQSWQTFASDKNRIAGYKFDGTQLQPIISPATDSESGSSEAENAAKIPLKLRGQNIGYVNVRFQDNTNREESMTVIEQIVERLAAALDNARLAEETRDRAQRDALVSELGGRFRSTLDLESVLRTAAQEFQRAFQLQEAEVRLSVAEDAESKADEPQKDRKNGKRNE